MRYHLSLKTFFELYTNTLTKNKSRLCTYTPTRKNLICSVTGMFLVRQKNNRKLSNVYISAVLSTKKWKNTLYKLYLHHFTLYLKLRSNCVMVKTAFYKWIVFHNAQESIIYNVTVLCRSARYSGAYWDSKGTLNCIKYALCRLLSFTVLYNNTCTTRERNKVLNFFLGIGEITFEHVRFVFF